ncbi:MAG: FAD-dependent oxidoreductase, partial [Chloroflexota bacterium]|nr:FAD-dependent oxidoreductase [Chloroflexota bacterium]
EKVWGISCKEIRAEWAAQRIRGLSFTAAVFNALFKPGGKRIRTLIEKFEYPRQGPGMMWEATKAFVEARGSRVLLNSPVVRIKHQDAQITSVIVSRSGREEEITGTHFISSLALRDLIRFFDPPTPDDVRSAAENLNYRDFIVVVLILNRSELFPDNWIYIHTPHARVGRIQNFKNWSPSMVPDPQMTSLGMEYFVSEGDELWSQPDEQLIEVAKQDLEWLKLASASEVVDGTVKRMRKAYPVYDSTYRENLNVVRGYLDSIENLQTVGRNGMHKYNNQDHSMMTGLLAARNICGEKNSLWAVNTDMEYQETIQVDLSNDAST